VEKFREAENASGYRLAQFLEFLEVGQDREEKSGKVR
jgi:hypothetical protein